MDLTEFQDLASPETAREAIQDLALSAGTERVPLEEATGRVLADRIDADIDVPGFDRASLDGFALRASDTDGADEGEPARLSVVGTVHTGERPPVAVEPGEAVEISTGAVMPTGADAMVPVELTNRTFETEEGETDTADEGDTEGTDADETVRVRTSVDPGENVAFAGSDVAAGERALGPGTTLSPREIGLLAALGTETVPVRSRLRVGIVPTGEELVPPGEAIDSTRGEIYDVNSETIAAAVEDAGGEAVRFPHVGDDWAAMEAVLRRAADECDLVLSSGSTSAGAMDVVHRVIEDLGEVLVHGVRVKPGKPMLVGRLGEAGYVGLPGYPVSALMVFLTFVAPAIRDAVGESETEATIRGRLAVDEDFAEDRHRLIPVGLVDPGPGETVGGEETLNADASRDVDESTGAEESVDRGGPSDGGDALVYPVDKGSGATTSLARADGIVEMPAAVDTLAAGSTVTVRPFGAHAEAPTLLVVGEDDPTITRALDAIDDPRYLPEGSGPAMGWLRSGVPDVAVVAGPLEDAHDWEPVARFEREWGLLVPAGNPDDVAGLADLVDRDLRFGNRSTDSGVRRCLDDALAALATDRGEKRDASATIDGYEVALRGHESPAGRVAAGEAAVGLGLAETAARLGLAFVPVGDLSVRLLANPARRGKAAIDRLADRARALAATDPER
ncbi:molybdopterin biosynthesis protein [Halovivax limisalsi]|uniref:molybdopterin biosynthesis protein n=1 Tax=Halovivax limisalsi TaxID=1453760 RepID=UPI001FFC5106|nr:molybdopterin biosynthesis protein [Halovivax limisalsi]